MSSNRPSGANDGGALDIGALTRLTSSSDRASDGLTQMATSALNIPTTLGQGIQLAISNAKGIYDLGSKGIKAEDAAYQMAFDLKMDSAEAPKLNLALNELGERDKTNLSRDSLNGIGMTLANDDISPEEFKQGILAVGRVTQATKASYEAVASSARKAHDDLKLGYGDLQNAMGILNDMGDPDDLDFDALMAAIPNLTQLAQNLGMSGTQGLVDLGAALKEAGTLTESPIAASAMVSETLKTLNSAKTQRAFKDAGIDLKARMAEGKANGISELTVAAQAAREVAGDDPRKLSALLNAPQAEMLLSKIGTDERFKEMRTLDPENKDKGKDSINALYAKRLENPQSTTETIDNATKRFGDSISLAFTDVIASVNTGLGSLINWGAEAAENNPNTIRAAGMVAVGVPIAIAAAPAEIAAVALVGAGTIALGMSDDVDQRRSQTSPPPTKPAESAPATPPAPPAQSPQSSQPLLPGEGYGGARRNGTPITLPSPPANDASLGPQGPLDPNRPLLADAATKGKVDVSITFANAPPAAISTRSDSPQVAVTTQTFSAALGPSMNGPV